MGFSENFKKKTLVEQVLALDEIDRMGRTETVPDLVALWQQAGLDEAVTISVGQTVRALLARSEAATVEGIASSDPRLQRMCIQVAARQQFAGAKPALLRLGASQADPTLLAEVLAALMSFGPDQSVELARANLRHPDDIVASLAVEAVGIWRDGSSLGTLCEIVSEAEGDTEYEICRMPTQKAIEALAVLASDEAVGFLAAKLHHRGPTARRLIHDALLALGPRILSHLGNALQTGDEDQKVLAANLLGLLRDRKGASLVVEAFDTGKLTHSNARFAAYEALGRIGGLASLVRLGEGLDDPDELVLAAVVGALEELANPAVVEMTAKRLQAGGEVAGRVARAVIASGAFSLFESLYPDPAAFEPLLAALLASRDGDTVDAFRQRLVSLPGERAAEAAKRLQAVEKVAPRNRVLAVDDSRSMLMFYRAALSELGVELTTAASGAEALTLLEAGESFDLILTDLNMPEMDGVELIRKVRENPFLAHIPIVMATTESENSQKEAARNAGVNDFLRKPMTPEMLCDTVRTHLAAPSFGG